MENRSFDSLLGSVQLQEMEIMTANPAPNGSMIYAKPTTDMVSYFDPGHMISDVTEQIYGTIDPKDFDHPSMSGFALNAARKARKIMFNQDRAMREVMNYYPTGSLPILQTLAQEYTVFDRWFASVPGPTFPNRHFIHCATSGGFGRNRLRIGGFPMKTIYDSMNENNRTWKYYFSGGVPFLALYNRMLRLQNLRNFRTLNGFFQDAKTGSFPDFTM
jgi:phospholipase C